MPAVASQILLSMHLHFPYDVSGFTISTTMGVTSPRERVEAMAMLLPFLPLLPRSTTCGSKQMAQPEKPPAEEAAPAAALDK